MLNERWRTLVRKYVVYARCHLVGNAVTRADRAELLTDVEGVSSRPVRRIVLRAGP
jgi:hypothetical protein